MNGTWKIRHFMEDVRNTLAAGRKIVVGGWQNRSHTDLTRLLHKRGVVTFFEDDSAVIAPAGTEIVIFTKNATQSQVDAMVRPIYQACRVYSRVSVEDIRRALLGYKDFNFPKTTPTGSPVTEKEKGVKMKTKKKAVPPPTKAEVAFAMAFITETPTAGDTLSRYKTAEIVRRTFGDTMTATSAVRSLQKHGLLERVLLEGGKKASSYRATERLEEISIGRSPPAGGETSVEPEAVVPKLLSQDKAGHDLLLKLEKARLLIAEEDEISREIARLNLRLEKIKRAKRVIEELLNL